MMSTVSVMRVKDQVTGLKNCRMITSGNGINLNLNLQLSIKISRKLSNSRLLLMHFLLNKPKNSLNNSMKLGAIDQQLKMHTTPLELN